jgi:hypothetical protein
MYEPQPLFLKNSNAFLFQTTQYFTYIRLIVPVLLNFFRIILLFNFIELVTNIFFNLLLISHNYFQIR